jgi:flagellar motor switch protein FliG
MLKNKDQISNKKFFRTKCGAKINPLKVPDRPTRNTKMPLTGKQRAAMLLMSVDSATAAELLDGIDAKVVKELAVELAHLDTSGFNGDRQSSKFTRQFCNSLQTNPGFQLKGFLKELMNTAVGNKRTEQIQGDIQELFCKQGPFASICGVESRMIASVLEGEHPQTAAVVLSELPKTKTSEVFSFLNGSICFSIVNRMGSCKTMPPETKVRITETVRKRIEAIVIENPESALRIRPEQSVRKVAVVLRDLGREIRDGLLNAIRGKDKQTSEMVSDLMVVWEDVPQITDKSLKKLLRRIDVKKLALALVRADDRTIKKVKSNISEPIAAMLNEQSLLMSAYGREDVERARGEIVQILREMNEKGDIVFIEEQCIMQSG